MSKLDFYRLAVPNLGLIPTINLQFKKRSRSPLLKLTSRQLDFPVYARRGTSDLSVFHQIFVEREYSCIDSLKVEGLIVDLGANVGYSSSYFLSRFPKSNVIAIEPDGGNLDCALMNTNPYGTRCRVIRAAIWPLDEKLAFQNETMGTGHEWGRKLKPSPSGEVDTITMPEVITGHGGIERIALLKVDIEGAEVDLFGHGADKWIDKVDNIVAELHGEEARRVFFNAISHRKFWISECGELTVCLS